MAIGASAYRVIEPSFKEPGLLVQYQQPSGYTDTLEGGEIRARLGTDNLAVYMKQVNIRTRNAGAQSAFNELPGVDIQASLISTASYLFRVRAEYDHHDVDAGANYGFSTPQAYTLGMRQAHAQQARDIALFGLQPQNGEGLLNAPGATIINLPADSGGNDTLVTYDNGEFAFFLSQMILLLKKNTLQLGQGQKFTVLGPQRALGLFEYNVVQLTSFQRVGAGTASSKGTFQEILMDNGDELTWSYDDTLQGAGGTADTDVIIIAMPELNLPVGAYDDTNAFAGLAPASPANITQYADKAAPTEIMVPLPGGVTDVTSEWRLTPGWAVRPQGLLIIKALYA